MIIADDPTVIRLTEYTLKQRGYTILTTCNGLEGLITAQKEEPDLIILDIMLLCIDGYDLCKRPRAMLRQDPDVILVGEIRDKETAVTAIQATLTGHLVFSSIHANDAASMLSRIKTSICVLLPRARIVKTDSRE